MDRICPVRHEPNLRPFEIHHHGNVRDLLEHAYPFLIFFDHAVCGV